MRLGASTFISLSLYLHLSNGHCLSDRVLWGLNDAVCVESGLKSLALTKASKLAAPAPIVIAVYVVQHLSGFAI